MRKTLAEEAASVRIHLPGEASAVTTRVASILASRIEEYSGARALAADRPDLNVHLSIKPGFGPEGFEISDAPDGGISICGNDERGLLYGAGKFLRASTYSSRGFTPGPWRGVSVPRKPVRGSYFATHFHNYYHEAPIEEVTRYVEDMALWGINAVGIWFGMNEFNGIEDPKGQAMIARLCALLKTAKDLGLSTCTGTVANEGYANSPASLRADDSTVGHPGYHSRVSSRLYNLGTEVCPNKPGARELILSSCEDKFAAFRSVDLDYWWIVAYDNGGCTCPQCAPWGTNGFLSMAEPVARAYQRRFPNGKVILSTWCFDIWADGEWAGITDMFNARKPDWVDYIQTDGHGGKFPDYPLTHGAPGGLPMLNFPEISMYHHSPWGGYGSNPLPKYLQSLWDQTRGAVSGGFPYSEGIYEDVNKVICAQLYWDPDQPTEETMKEYIAFYFSPGVVDTVSRAMDIMERNLERVREDKDGITRFILKHTEGAEEAFRLVAEADSKLPARVRTSWRWRIVYLRTLIDSELVTRAFRVSAACAAAFQELTALYHTERGDAVISPPRDLTVVVP